MVLWVFLILLKMKEDELQFEIDNIWSILLKAKECFYFSYYLHKARTTDEQNYIEISSEFKLIREVMWKMSVIELAKLYSNSDSHKFNLHKFIKKMLDNKVGIDNALINSWSEKIKEHDETIILLKSLRDKLYAHTDRNINLHTEKVTFELFEKLIGITENIIQNIYIIVFNASVHIPKGRFYPERFKIIEILASEKPRKAEELLNSIKLKQLP